MVRQLKGNVSIYGVDSESFGSDEKKRQTFSVSGNVHPKQTIDLQPAVMKWGGECRVELTMKASATPKGDVYIDGRALLFEGTSENSGDLDDNRTFSFTVPRTTVAHPNSATYVVNLKNRESGGGDWARIDIEFWNTLLETA